MQAQIFQNTDLQTNMKLDPRTKLILMMALNIVLVGGASRGVGMYIGPVLSAIPFILLLSSRRMKVAFFYLGFYGLSWIADVFFLGNSTGILNLVILLLAGLGIRWVPCGVMGYYLLTTTRVSEFVAAMERMKVTQKIIIPMSVMFRFIPTVLEESRAIGDAMRMRGVGVRSFFSNPTAMLEYRLVPLMMSIVKIGNELSAAALTRGLGGPIKRTNICKIGFGLWDVMFIIIVVLAMAMFMIF